MSATNPALVPVLAYMLTVRHLLEENMTAPVVDRVKTCLERGDVLGAHAAYLAAHVTGDAVFARTLGVMLFSIVSADVRTGATSAAAFPTPAELPALRAANVEKAARELVAEVLEAMTLWDEHPFTMTLPWYPSDLVQARARELIGDAWQVTFSDDHADPWVSLTDVNAPGWLGEEDEEPA